MSDDDGGETDQQRTTPLAKKIPGQTPEEVPNEKNNAARREGNTSTGDAQPPILSIVPPQEEGRGEHVATASNPTHQVSPGTFLNVPTTTTIGTLATSSSTTSLSPSLSNQSFSRYSPDTIRNNFFTDVAAHSQDVANFLRTKQWKETNGGQKKQQKKSEEGGSKISKNKTRQPEIIAANVEPLEKEQEKNIVMSTKIEEEEDEEGNRREGHENEGGEEELLNRTNFTTTTTTTKKKKKSVDVEKEEETQKPEQLHQQQQQLSNQNEEVDKRFLLSHLMASSSSSSSCHTDEDERELSVTEDATISSTPSCQGRSPQSELSPPQISPANNKKKKQQRQKKNTSKQENPPMQNINNHSSTTLHHHHHHQADSSAVELENDHGVGRCPSSSSDSEADGVVYHCFDQEEEDWIFARYRQERLNEILQRAGATTTSPSSNTETPFSMYSGSNHPGVEGGRETPESRLASSRQSSEMVDENTSFFLQQQRQSISAAYHNTSHEEQQHRHFDPNPSSHPYRRSISQTSSCSRSSSRGSSVKRKGGRASRRRSFILQAVGLTTEELELCRRLETEMKGVIQEKEEEEEEVQAKNQQFNILSSIAAWATGGQFGSPAASKSREPRMITTDGSSNYDNKVLVEKQSLSVEPMTKPQQDEGSAVEVQHPQGEATSTTPTTVVVSATHKDNAPTVNSTTTGTSNVSRTLFTPKPKRYFYHHCNPLERHRILRMVKCKKTYEKCGPALLKYSSLLDRFGIDLMQYGDVSGVLSTGCMAFLDPSLIRASNAPHFDCIFYVSLAKAVALVTQAEKGTKNSNATTTATSVTTEGGGGVSNDPGVMLRAALYELERAIVIMSEEQGGAHPNQNPNNAMTTNTTTSESEPSQLNSAMELLFSASENTTSANVGPSSSVGKTANGKKQNNVDSNFKSWTSDQQSPVPTPNHESICLLIDGTNFAVGDHLKTVHTFLSYFKEQLKGVYPFRISKIILHRVGTGSVMSNLLIKGLEVKALPAKLRSRLCHTYQWNNQELGKELLGGDVAALDNALLNWENKLLLSRTTSKPKK